MDLQNGIRIRKNDGNPRLVIVRWKCARIAVLLANHPGSANPLPGVHMEQVKLIDHLDISNQGWSTLASFN